MFTIKEIIEATGSKLIKGNLGSRVKGVSIDSRTIMPGELFIAIKGPSFDGHNFIDDAFKHKAAAVIISDEGLVNLDGLSMPIIKSKCTTEALTNLALYHRSRFKFPVIAVTGTNGKTTTKELIACCLSKKFKVFKSQGNQNNQLGLSLNLLKLNPDYEICVMEVGTNNFGEIENLAKILKPTIGLITNIGPAHLEGLKNIRGVFREKTSLFKNLSFPSLGFLNSDDKMLNNLLSAKRPNIFSFGYKNNAEFKINDLKSIDDKILFTINKQRFILNTIVRHNVYNALAAIAVSRIFGISYKNLISALNSFNWLDGRFKRYILGNIHLIDDTYNANPLSFNSAIDALENYNRKKILVMGDMLELGNLSEKYHFDLAKKINKSSIDLFIGLGNYSKKIAEFLKNNSKKTVYTVKDTEEAISIVKSNLSPKPTTILVKGSHAFKLENVILHFLSVT